DDHKVADTTPKADDHKVADTTPKADDHKVADTTPKADDHKVADTTPKADDHKVADTTPKADDHKVADATPKADDHKVADTTPKADDHKVADTTTQSEDHSSKNGKAFVDASEKSTMGGESIDDGKPASNGTSGNDQLHGSTGDDAIHGGAGNDAIHGSGGHDSLYGDAGNDLFVFGQIDGHTHVDGGGGVNWTDVIEIDLGHGPAADVHGNWTLEIDGQKIVDGHEHGQLDVHDKHGTVTTEHGTVEFDNIDKIQW
ncbi:MAG: hypothetical protein KGZ83_04525, partial [Sulfuricella sp.]|nr:hypothetical protein [Sulfuricella sp.]